MTCHHLCWSTWSATTKHLSLELQQMFRQTTLEADKLAFDLATLQQKPVISRLSPVMHPRSAD